MSYSPYEMKILLEVHCGAGITANQNMPLFHETMDDFCARGLVQKTSCNFAPTPELNELMRYVLGAPRPIQKEARRALTEKQRMIFTFLKDHLAAKGFTPTRADIADHFGFASPNAAQDHLLALEKKGYIKLGIARARGIKIIQ